VDIPAEPTGSTREAVDISIENVDRLVPSVLSEGSFGALGMDRWRPLVNEWVLCGDGGDRARTLSSCILTAISFDWILCVDMYFYVFSVSISFIKTGECSRSQF